MDCLTDGVISPESKGEIADASAYFSIGKVFLNPPDGLYKIDSIIIMFLNPRSNGQNIGIKNYIPGFKSDFFSKNFICPAANLDTPVKGVGLASFIKCHYYHCSPILFYQVCLQGKYFFAFF